MRPENAKTGLVVVVVEYLSEVVCPGINQDVLVHPSWPFEFRNALLTRRHTLDGLLREEPILHAFHAVAGNCGRDDGLQILQDYSPLEFGMSLQQCHALLAIATAHVDKYWRVYCCVQRKLRPEVDNIEPCWQRGELQFHEVMKSPLLNRMGLHPLIESSGGMLPQFKCGARLAFTIEEAIQGEKWRNAAIVTTRRYSLEAAVAVRHLGDRRRTSG